MPELTIYTSVGEPYAKDGVQKNTQIEEFFFNDVRLAVDLTRGVKISGFFRAREQANRAEQYYAVYEASRQSANPFDEFIEAVQSRVEDEFGLQLDTSTEDTAVFSALSGTTTDVAPPGSEFDQSTVSRLLQKGRRLRVGVQDVYRALSLGRWAVDDVGAQSFAIAEGPAEDALRDYDLQIEVGSYSGIEPLGETTEQFAAAKRENQSEYISSKVSTIRSEIQDLKSETTLSSSQIRQRLKRDLNTFDDPSVSTQATVDDSEGKDLIDWALIGMIGLGVVITAVLVASMIFSVSIPGVSGVISGGTPAASIVGVSGENVSMNSDTIEVSGTSSEMAVKTRGLGNRADVLFQTSDGTVLWEERSEGITDGNLSVSLNTSKLQANISYFVILNSTTNNQSVRHELVFSPPQRTEERSSPATEITNLSGEHIDVSERGNVTLQESTVSMNVQTTGFGETVRVQIAPEKEAEPLAQDTELNGSKEFTAKLNVSSLSPNTVYKLFVISEVDSSRSATRAISYEPARVAQVTGEQNATVQDETVTITGPATLRIDSAYPTLTATITNTSVEEPLDLTDRTAQLELDPNETAAGTDLRISPGDSSKNRTWSYEVNAENNTARLAAPSPDLIAT